MTGSVQKGTGNKSERIDILIIGSGGREHALCWKARQSPRVEHIYCAPGNAGTAQLATNVSIDINDHKALIRFARDNQIGLTIVGPEAPLTAGIVDAFEAADLHIFGPSQEAAKLEGSKGFAKAIMRDAGIPTPTAKNFSDIGEASRYIESHESARVVKADGLAAGKGVHVCDSAEEAIKAASTLLKTHDSILVEERLEGVEISFLGFSDGNTILPLPSAQDHKRAYEGDLGPNTGGMGAYAPYPDMTPELEQEIIETVMLPTLRAMDARGTPYKGILYAGLMLTAQGTRVLEFNCRFGDPETQPLLSLLASDLVELCLATIEGSLHHQTIASHPGAACCVVLTSGGYPRQYQTGKPIGGIANAAMLHGVEVFQAGTRQEGGAIYTDGGRVLGVTAHGHNLGKAIDLAYEAADRVHYPGKQMRRDIGKSVRGRKVPTKKGQNRIAILASTRGTVLQTLIDRIESGELDVQIGVVISDRECPALERARRHHIPAVAISPNGKSREAFDREVSMLIEELGADLVLLVGYMRLMSEWFVHRYKDRVMNIHPSLLPAFAGGMDLNVHEAVIDRGCKLSGASLIFIDEGADSGPIISQQVVQVQPGELPTSLKARVQEAEGQLLLKAIPAYFQGRLRVENGKVIHEEPAPLADEPQGQDRIMEVAR